MGERTAFDAHSWFLTRTAGPVGLAVAGLLFLAPALSGLLGRAFKENAIWLNDFNALLCGAVNAAGGHPLYDPAFQCEAWRSAPYVYAPWLARWLAPLAGQPGAVTAIYVGLFVLAVLALVWLALLRPQAGRFARERLPFMALITGSAVACGNIGIAMHAVVALLALGLPRWRWGFVLAVAAACAVKPMFATYLIVLALEERPLARRAISAGAAAVLCVGVALIAAHVPDPQWNAWRGEVEAIVLGQLHQSIGLFGWFAYFGAPTHMALLAPAYVIYAAALSVAGLIVAARLDARGRVALGLAMAALLNPRLMDYDLWLLGPGMAMVGAAAVQASAKAGRWAWGAIYGACALTLVLNIADMAPLGMHLAPPIFAATVLATAMRLRQA